MVNIARSVELGGKKWPTRPALLFQGTSTTYRDLDQRSHLLASGFQSQGLARGDRIALLLPNSPQFVECYLATLKLGAIAVSLNPALAPEEVGFQLRDCGASALVTTSLLVGAVPHQTLPELKQIWIADGESTKHPSLAQLFTAPLTPQFHTAEMSPEEPAAIVYTSGTMGQPKGATLSHGNILSNMAAKKRCLGIRPEDRLLLFLPLFHCFGQNAVLNSGLGAGATLVLHAGFEMERVLKSIADDQVTMFFGIPTTFLLLEEKASPAALAGVRYFFSAATTLPRSLEQRWRERFGKVIHQGYGLTETSPFASYNHLREYREGSIGMPIEGVEMEIVDPDSGSVLGPGEAGEITIRGHNVMLGYWQRPEETAAAIRNGWFFTGDIGRRDEDGYYYIEDRLKDMVSVGGLKVYPAEVENVLHQHPQVADAAVFGTPEPLLGERVEARVVLQEKSDISPPDLEDFCRSRLAQFKVPTQIRFVTELPRSPSGKLLKRTLRQQALEEAKAGGESPTPLPNSPNSKTSPQASSQASPQRNQGNREGTDQLDHWLRSWLAEALGTVVERVPSDSSFFDLGLDSALAVRLATELSHFTGHTIEATALWNHTTVEALSRFAQRLPTSPRELRITEAPSKTTEPTEDLSGFSDDHLAELLRAEIAGTES
ncbi:MAG: AMP-binding protein [Deltaproteobacteria bacterium]|nr:AMP-binding protein [Deltaproteobacteria bacterium]